MKRIRPFGAMLAAALLANACVTPAGPTPNPGLVRGVPKESVTSILGQPLRTEKHPDGSETWYYHTNTYKTRSTGHDNFEQPGETVSERDLRHGFEGFTSSMTFEREAHPVEYPVAISPHGILSTTPRKKLLPNHHGAPADTRPSEP